MVLVVFFNALIFKVHRALLSVYKGKLWIKLQSIWITAKCSTWDFPWRGYNWSRMQWCMQWYITPLSKAAPALGVFFWVQFKVLGTIFKIPHCVGPSNLRDCHSLWGYLSVLPEWIGKEHPSSFPLNIASLWDLGSMPFPFQPLLYGTFSLITSNRCHSSVFA